MEEINAIKVVLDSFARYEDEDLRKKHLRSQLDIVPSLSVYFGFTSEQLMIALTALYNHLPWKQGN